MTVLYIDTSAAMKLLVDEAESVAVAEYLTRGDTLVSSWLLHAELHCAAGRRGAIAHSDVSIVLDAMDLVDLTRGDLIGAAGHPPLRSNDAIHLAVAIRIGADELVTYDRELAEAAAGVGLRVASPGIGGRP